MVVLHGRWHQTLCKQQRLIIRTEIRGGDSLLHYVRKDLQPELAFARGVLPQDLLGCRLLGHTPQGRYAV